MFRELIVVIKKKNSNKTKYSLLKKHQRGRYKIITSL